MNQFKNKILYSFIEIMMLAILSVIPTVTVLIDCVIINNIIKEVSVTELTQALLLFSIISVFSITAIKNKNSRGFLVLAAGFFSCMLIRELDGFLDNIYHGFWFWPAIVTAIASIIYAAFFCRNTIIKPMSDFINTKPYFFIIFGLIVVMVFSRIFGSGNVFWKHILSSEYMFLIKGVLQEGIELFGYLFLAYGSFLFLFQKNAD